MPGDEYAELIAFLGRKFDTIDERFAVMDQRFASMDRRFDGIEEKLAEHDVRFQEVLGHLEHIYGRLERLTRQRRKGAEEQGSRGPWGALAGGSGQSAAGS